MPAVLTQAQTEQLKLLRAADDGTLPKHIAQDMTEFSRDILRELCDSGLITATKFQPVAGPADFLNPKITLPGRRYLAELEQLAVPDHAAKPPDSEPPDLKKQVDEPWHKRLLGDIWVSVVKGLLLAAAIWAIAHWWSVLLGVIG